MGSHPPLSELLERPDHPHLAGCAECRASLALAEASVAPLLGEVPESDLRDVSRRLIAAAAVPARRSLPLRPAWAAAAALFLAAVGAWALRARGPAGPVGGEGTGMSEASVRPPAPFSPGSDWKTDDDDLETVLGKAVSVSLRKGSVLRAGASELALRLERGTAYLETRGERVRLAVGGLVAELDEGAIAAEAGPAGSALGAVLLRAAGAAEAEGAARVTAVSGRVRVSVGSQVRELRAGESVRWTADALEPCASVAWRGASWMPLPRASGSVRDGSFSILPDAPPQGYVLEALLRKRSAGAETGVSFRAGAGGYLVMVGDNRIPAGEGCTRLRVEVSAGWCRVSFGSQKAVSMPVAGLRDRLQASEERGVSLRAWGGDFTVEAARWRPLP